MATDTMFEFMGVRVDPLDDTTEIHDVAMQTLAAPVAPAGKVTRGPNGYSIDGRLNDSFRAVNLLFDKNVAIRRVDKASAGLRPGDFLIPTGSESTLEAVAKQTGVDFTPLRAPVSTGVHDTKRLRVAMYQRYGGGNIDEGWSRLTLEQFSFPYTSLFDPELKKGSLKDKYDVIIFPTIPLPPSPVKPLPQVRQLEVVAAAVAGQAERAEGAAGIHRRSIAPVSAPKESRRFANSFKRAGRW